MLSWTERLQYERLGVRIHRLGPRPLTECLIESGEANGPHSANLARLTRYANIHPAALQLAGGDRFAPSVFPVAT